METERQYCPTTKILTCRPTDSYIATTFNGQTASIKALLDNAWAGVEGMRLGSSGESVDSMPTASELVAFYGVSTSTACGKAWGADALPCCFFPSCVGEGMNLPPSSIKTLYLVADASAALVSSRSRGDFLHARSRLRSEVDLTHRMAWQSQRGTLPAESFVYKDARMVTSPLLSSLRMLLSNPQSWYV